MNEPEIVLSEVNIPSEEVEEKIEVIDLIPANPQQSSKAFVYKVFVEDNPYFIATVIAITATGAKEGLLSQFNNSTITYLGTSKFIMQVNG